MTDQDDFTSLRGLHQDLLALERAQSISNERLWEDLDSRVDDFKKLLDRSPKNETSRNAILSGISQKNIIVQFVTPIC